MVFSRTSFGRRHNETFFFCFFNFERKLLAGVIIRGALGGSTAAPKVTAGLFSIAKGWGASEGVEVDATTGMDGVDGGVRSATLLRTAGGGRIDVGVGVNRSEMGRCIIGGGAKDCGASAQAGLSSDIIGWCSGRGGGNTPGINDFSFDNISR